MNGRIRGRQIPERLVGGEDRLKDGVPTLDGHEPGRAVPGRADRQDLVLERLLYLADQADEELARVARAECLSGRLPYLQGLAPDGQGRQGLRGGRVVDPTEEGDGSHLVGR